MCKRDPSKPCAGCVFRRDSQPGYLDIANLGGSEAKVYIGQTHGPFAIPCHTHVNFQDPEWREKSFPGETPQCAGAAIFRANLRLNDIMPQAIPQLPMDEEMVFSTAEEFVAHHLNVTRETAYSLLRTPGYRIQDLVRDELTKAGVMVKERR